MLDALFSFLKDIFFLAGYVNTGGSFPEPLSREEEQECIKALAAGDAAARTRLIEHNLRLVAHIAKKYTAAHRDADDLISIGTVGLIKAISTFDANKSSALATYAARCIENEILMSLRAEKKQSGEVSLCEPIGTDRDGNEISLSEVLGSDPDDVHNAAELALASQRLREVIAMQLEPREQVVIRLRYGLYGGAPLPQREVAARLDISRSYVSRIEKKAIAKLTQAFYADSRR